MTEYKGEEIRILKLNTTTWDRYHQRAGKTGEGSDFCTYGQKSEKVEMC